MSYRLCLRRFLNKLLQLCVLRLGLLQDGDVGVGVFPEGEEIIVGGAGFDGVVLHGIGSADLEMREHPDDRLPFGGSLPGTTIPVRMPFVENPPFYERNLGVCLKLGFTVLRGPGLSFQKPRFGQLLYCLADTSSEARKG